MKFEKLAGKFITFEGGEGGGKTTQSKLLADFLNDNKPNSTLWTREPGGCESAEEIRNLLVKGSANKFDGVTEILLMYASRQVHTENKIKPALNEGKTVISDRYFDSTLAYQGYGSLIEADRINKIREAVLRDFKPDLSIIFDIEVENGLKRAFKRGETNRFEEKQLDYHKRVREGFIEIAKNNPERCVLLNVNDLEVEEVQIKVLKIIQKHFDL